MQCLVRYVAASANVRGDRDAVPSLSGIARFTISSNSTVGRKRRTLRQSIVYRRSSCDLMRVGIVASANKVAVAIRGSIPHAAMPGLDRRLGQGRRICVQACRCRNRLSAIGMQFTMIDLVLSETFGCHIRRVVRVVRSMPGDSMIGEFPCVFGVLGWFFRLGPAS